MRSVRWPWSRRRVTFDSAPRPIDLMFAEMLRSSGTTVARGEALSVPAVRRGRNQLCSVATMPLEQVGPDNEVDPNPLLAQIDPDVPNVVTISQTVEDLVFEGIAWWLKTAEDFAGFPVAARHLDVSIVSLKPPEGRNPSPLPSGVDPRGGVVWVDGKPVAGSRVIRFDSPNPAVLKHAGREIRRAILLDKAASMYADDPRPLDYFTPADGADPVDDEEVKEILGKWKAARKARSTGYVPAALGYHSVDAPSPQQLQLVELQRQASLDIANSLGIDPEDLGISTTSRTYSNDVDRRRNKLNDVLKPYMRAITDRLSMGDVTRPGFAVRFNTTEYLQPNPTDRWAIYETAVRMGAMTLPEVRQPEGLPALPDTDEGATTVDETSTRELQLVEQIQKIYLGVGTVVTAAEAREILNRSGAGLVVNAPVGTAAPPPPAPSPVEEPVGDAEQVEATQPALVTFDRSPGLTFVDVPATEFSVDVDRRIIEGLILPYNAVADQGGYRFQFERGSLQYSETSRVKLLRDHDMHQPLGKAVKLHDKASGMYARFSVARGVEGDRALELAEDGVLDGFSVGVDFDLAADTSLDRRDKNLRRVHRSDLREVSLTPMPSFDTARVTKVAASRNQGGGHVADTPEAPESTEPPAVPDPQTPDTVPAPPDPAPEPTGLNLSQDQLAAVLAVPGTWQAITRQPTPEPTAPVTALNLSMDQVGQLMEWARASASSELTPAPAPAATEGPTPVDPTRTLNLALTQEALPYRFDRGGRFTTTEHEFSTDVVDMVKRGDFDGTGTDAGRRVMALVRAKFADVDVADVNELNPDIQRPDMYVDQRDFRYPIWESISKGAPPNGVQPFVFPKFASASGLVGDHTEGVEPTGGTFVTTSQTVTPTALSGKASLTREIWDTGGNPAVSTLIWNQMQRSWREGLESAAATFLNTLTAATDISLGVAVTDEALAAAWDIAIADLQFVRGYDFEMFAVEQRLYRAFVDATATDGRKIYPQINPQNASGTSERRFSRLDLAGVVGVPAWALTATPGAANNSWLFDPMTVHGWASPPQRLDLLGSGGAAAGVEYKPVAYVDIAIWGYKAFANSDIGGVRQVTYDDA